jgi:hypothetical protein
LIIVLVLVTGVSDHLLREYLAQLIGDKAPEVVALGFLPRRRHPLSLSIPIYNTTNVFHRNSSPLTWYKRLSFFRFR